MCNILESDSNKYWAQDKKLESQRLYVQFTLFCSAVMDFANGLEFSEHSRLNWSASAFYYSMVHSCRFLLFSVVGNFPTGHGQLLNLLKDKRSIQCNWLPNFRNRIEDRSNNDSLTYNELIAFLEEIRVDNSENRLEKIGKIVENAKLLREDSNYESLLIAHEYNHSFVTPEFKRLTTMMQNGCQYILSFISEVYLAFLINYPFGNLTAQQSKDFVDFYIGKRIVNQIKDRYYSDRIFEILKRTVGHGLRTTTIDLNNIRHMEDDISFELFDRKSNLMRTFSSKITTLKKVIEE